MPSLAEVHGNRGRSSTDDEAGGTGRPVSADDAAQVTLELSTTGVLLFLLGIGFAFFFDSLLGTVGYLLLLGLGAWGLARWIVATVPDRNLPPFLRTGPSARTRSDGGWRAIRRRLGSGRSSSGRIGGRSTSRRSRTTPLARLRDTVRAYRSSKGGERL